MFPEVIEVCPKRTLKSVKVPKTPTLSTFHLAALKFAILAEAVPELVLKASTLKSAPPPTAKDIGEKTPSFPTGYTEYVADVEVVDIPLTNGPLIKQVLLKVPVIKPVCDKSALPTYNGVADEVLITPAFIVNEPTLKFGIFTVTPEALVLLTVNEVKPA